MALASLAAGRGGDGGGGGGGGGGAGFTALGTGCGLGWSCGCGGGGGFMTAAEGTVVVCCGWNVGFPDAFAGAVPDVPRELPLELPVEPAPLSRGCASRRASGNGLMDVSAGIVPGNLAVPPDAFDPPAPPGAFDPAGPPLRGLIGACLIALFEGGVGGGGPPGCGEINAGLLDGTTRGGPPGPPGCGNAVEAGGVSVVVGGVVGAKVVGMFLGAGANPEPPGAGGVP